MRLVPQAIREAVSIQGGAAHTLVAVRTDHGYRLDGPRADGGARSWQVDRANLVEMAFRMLGNIGDAEDVVQDANQTLGWKRKSQACTSIELPRCR
jgi:hypothetical protein